MAEATAAALPPPIDWTFSVGVPFHVPSVTPALIQPMTTSEACAVVVVAPELGVVDLPVEPALLSKIPDVSSPVT